ncbi:MAG TPA: nuclease [Chloroflexia bacterium]|nr:nuclease [Chloroflexia bacterium]
MGLASNPRGNAKAQQCNAWVEALLAGGDSVVIPEIADYEIRRELIRARKTSSLQYLDELIRICRYAPLNTEILRRAAELWAQARQQGQQTADDRELDADMILAAQAEFLATPNAEVIVATLNRRHLSRFVNAQFWYDIQPAPPIV